jgi:hypothetical protein
VGRLTEAWLTRACLALLTGTGLRGSGLRRRSHRVSLRWPLQRAGLHHAVLIGKTVLRWSYLIDPALRRADSESTSRDGPILVVRSLAGASG